MGSRVRLDRARRRRRRGGDGELAEVGERRAPGQQSLLSVVPSQAGSTLARTTTPRRDPRFVALPMLIVVSLVISRLIHTMPARALPGTIQALSTATLLLFDVHRHMFRHYSYDSAVARSSLTGRLTHYHPMGHQGLATSDQQAILPLHNHDVAVPFG
jgi:hypothetical protein